jgi:hypothetical protein
MRRAVVQNQDQEQEQEHDHEHAHEVDPSTTVGAAVQRTKGDRRALKHADLPLLQGAVGNSVMAGMLVGVQRHSIKEKPPAPKPEELDDAELAQTQTLPVQRWDKATASKALIDGAKGAVIGANRTQDKKEWARAVGAQPPPNTKVKIGTRIPVLGAVHFTRPQLDADGVSTGKALIPRAPSRKMNWTFESDAGGSTIAPDGTITAGNDLKGAESKKVDVKAADVLSPGAQATGTFELFQPGILEAKKDLAQFLAKGPYTHKDFKTDNGFGKFDTSYDPTNNLLAIGMRLKFVFPDDKNTIFTGKKERAARKQRHEDYRKDFIGQVTAAWSGKFQFQNVREPKSVWARLNPVNVAVNVTPTQDKAAHFLLKAMTKTEGTANVSSRQVTTMYKGDDKAKENFTVEATAGELSRVKKAAPDVFFTPNTSELTDASKQSIDFLSLYLRRLNTPKFHIAAVAHARDAKRASERASALGSALNSVGAHVINPTGRTDKAAAPKGSFEPKVDPGYKNQQDVTAHEFGHMLGLDDEYDVGGNAGQGIETYDRVNTALGTDYADLTAKAGIDSESVMDGGSDVRIQHYITMWDVLGKLTQKKASVPAARFGDADWKFVG